MKCGARRATERAGLGLHLHCSSEPRHLDGWVFTCSETVSSPANRIIPIITAPPPPAPALGTRVTSGVPLPHRAIQWNDSLLCKPFMKVKCPAHKSPADSIAFPSNSFWASQALLTSHREGGLWSRQIVLWRKLMLLTTKSTNACIIFFDL